MLCEEEELPAIFWYENVTALPRDVPGKNNQQICDVPLLTDCVNVYVYGEGLPPGEMVNVVPSRGGGEMLETFCEMGRERKAG